MTAKDRMLERGAPRFMDRRVFLAGLASASAWTLAGCATNPVTGRSQLSLVSEEQLVQASGQAWKEIQAQSVRSTDTAVNRRIRDIGRRCVEGAGQGHRDWEFAVFEDPAINAFVLPGGQVAFYTGLLDAAENDGQVAAVMGHEIGHVTGRHASERASQHLAANLGFSIVAGVLIGSSREDGQLLAAVLGAGIVYGIILPYSREHEYEADRLGLEYMHAAGYDPQEAVNFWEIMNGMDRRRPLEFMSTHPAPAKRMKRLQEEAARLA